VCQLLNGILTRDAGNKLIGVEVRRCYAHQGAKTVSLLYLSLHVIITGGSIKTTFIDKNPNPLLFAKHVGAERSVFLTALFLFFIFDMPCPFKG